MTALVELSAITKSFGGVHALRGADLTVMPGEVHALLGENGAGKSTLMRVLGGEFQPTSGEVRVGGEPVLFHGPRDAIARGITIIHQEMALAPDLSVAENIFLKDLPAGISWRTLKARARDLIRRLGFDINPGVLVGELSVAHQQVVEIAKALSREARVIVFDEPTAVLAARDADRLLDIITDLRRHGVGVVYISHRLEEVFRIADRMTVMKDGQVVDVVTPAQCDMDGVIRLMVGRPVNALFASRAGRKTGAEVLRVEKLNAGRRVRDVSFSVRAGEVVGLGGLVGSGRTEVARLIFGADARDSGHIYLDGKPLSVHKPGDAVAAGIGLVPEDRKGQGVILDLPIRVNATMAGMGAVTNRFGFIRRAAERATVTGLAKALRLKAASIDAPVSSLSGGNQQKVVLAKWFHAGGRVIILDEPTRGVDVGAKAEIYALIEELADKGCAVIVISSEHQELFGLCDRVLVMGEGEIRGELMPDAFSEENLLSVAISRTTSRTLAGAPAAA
ncbi:sugar ABC transporter ATP-binding protein [Pseudoxanthobacter sp.]|uniref:sugar ABC transporter ATP-binding protein n=1 Tax=Pseudoxanthobacter sp. TaxID=1925742 RepID=UPI002FE1DA87